MKKILLLIAITAVIFLMAAKDPEPKEGLNFFQGTWKEAVQKARDENKPIFLDIYATWCGPCKMLKRNTFSNTKVAEFYNNSFINVSLDGEQGDGSVLASQLKIIGYPSLLFFDKNGSPILYSAGYVEAGEFIKMGKEALRRNNK